MEYFNQHEQEYLMAQKRVKEIKGFYIHALVYIVINAGLLLANNRSGADLSNINAYWTAILWGVGLAAHGASVFLPGLLFGADWEQRKIRELMDKNRK